MVKQGGAGYHVGYLKQTDPSRLIWRAKYLLSISSTYFLAICIPKLAILAFYRRIFPQRYMRIVIYVIAGIVISTFIACIIASLAACRPFQANYDPTFVGGQCIDKMKLYIWTSIPNIVTDVAMLTLPLPTVWKLNTNLRTKLALSFTFLVGSL